MGRKNNIKDEDKRVVGTLKNVRKKNPRIK